MKKTISLLLAMLLIVLCLSGCGRENKENPQNVYIWTDEETGVQYVIFSESYGGIGRGGITPRLNLDGTLYNSNGE